MMRCSASSVASCTPFHCTKIYSDFLVEFATSRVVPNFSFRSTTMTHFSCIEKLFSFHFLPPLRSRIQSHFQISHALDTLKLHHFPCPARSTRKKSFAGKLTNSTLTDQLCIKQNKLLYNMSSATYKNVFDELVFLANTRGAVLGKNFLKMAGKIQWHYPCYLVILVISKVGF